MIVVSKRYKRGAPFSDRKVVCFTFGEVGSLTFEVGEIPYRARWLKSERFSAKICDPLRKLLRNAKIP